MLKEAGTTQDRWKCCFVLAQKRKLWVSTFKGVDSYQASESERVSETQGSQSAVMSLETLLSKTQHNLQRLSVSRISLSPPLNLSLSLSTSLSPNTIFWLPSCFISPTLCTCLNARPSRSRCRNVQGKRDAHPRIAGPWPRCSCLLQDPGAVLTPALCGIHRRFHTRPASRLPPAQFQTPPPPPPPAPPATIELS